MEWEFKNGLWNPVPPEEEWWVDVELVSIDNCNVEEDDEDKEWGLC